MTKHADNQDWSEKTVFSTGEAAQICSVSQQTIIRCFDSGRLQGFRVPGSKFRRIPRKELIRFMRENEIPIGTIEGALRRVLCIHEEPSPIEIVSDIFAGRLRIEVRSATNAYDAGVLSVHFRPHLILLDDRMESVPLSQLHECVSRVRGPDRPRVVIVGRCENEAERDHRLRAGADGVIALPLTEEELIDAVMGWIDMSVDGKGDG